MLDTATGRVTRRLPTPAGAHELVATANGDIVASLYRAGELLFLHADGTSELVAVAQRPHGLAALDDGTLLATLGDDAALAALDSDGHELWRTAVGAIPHAVIAGPGGRAYTANGGDGSISVVDLHSRTEVRRIAAGALAESIDIGRDGTIYVANARDGTVSLIPPGGEPRTVVVGGRPVRVAAMPEGGALVAIAGSGTLAAIDGGGVVWTLDIGPAPDGIALDPTGRWAFVAENASSTVVAVDLVSRAIVASYEIGGGPSGLLFVAAP